MVTWTVQHTRIMLFMILKMHVDAFVFPQKGYIFMHDPAPCCYSKSTRTFLECNGISVPE